jgi:hypothetical protein
MMLVFAGFSVVARRPDTSRVPVEQDIIRARAVEIVNAAGAVVLRLTSEGERSISKELRDLSDEVRGAARGDSLPSSDSDAANRDGVIQLFAHNGAAQGEIGHGRLWLSELIDVGSRYGRVTLTPGETGRQLAVRDTKGHCVAALGANTRGSGVAWVGSDDRSRRAVMRVPEAGDCVVSLESNSR